MIVASHLGSIVSMRWSTMLESAARAADPRAARSANEMTQSPSPSPSRTTTLATPGMSSRMERSLATCSAFSANATFVSLSARMNATSSAIVVG